MKFSVPRLSRICAVVLLVFVTSAQAGEADCGVLQNWLNFGPFDYHDPENRVSTGADPMGRIKRVENAHFNEIIKSLDLKQLSLWRLTADIAYTLRVFPNHAEALHALSRLELKVGGKLPQQAVTPFTPRISADCFFDRALRFRPEDKGVHLMHGMHLHQRKRYTEALQAYETAESLGEDSATLFYNLGLLHADMKNWQRAAEYADKAYSNGAPYPGLRKRIEAAGHKFSDNPAQPATVTGNEK